MNDYRNPGLDIDKRVEDLLNRMTLEEMILQTDQYFSPDFTERGPYETVTAVNLDQLDSLLHGNSVGSIQARGMTPAQINQLQRYAIEKTRLGIPFLFSEEALHGLCHLDATAFPQQIGLAASFEPDLGRKMGRVIGGISLHMNWRRDDAILGAVLNRRETGRGYMTEAMRGVLSLAFEQLRLHRIHAVCDVDNAAMLHVLEKSGFRNEGRMLQRGKARPEAAQPYFDQFGCALLREEWQRMNDQGQKE